MLNHIDIMGRLARDPELRYTQNQTPVVSFTLAVDRDFSGKDGGQKETDWIDCVAWRHTAEFVSKYFHKGSMAVASGRLQLRDWTDQNNNKRRSAEVVVDNIYFGESKRESERGSYGQQSYGNPQGYVSTPDYGGTGYGRNYQPPAQPQYQQQTFTEMDDDDGEIPF